MHLTSKQLIHLYKLNIFKTVSVLISCISKLDRVDNDMV